ncbi:MAG: hypothetical protein Q8936_10600 [Bacillota bacterium]|nr:hypothetical protein [Bacillota bacterium]
MSSDFHISDECYKEMCAISYNNGDILPLMLVDLSGWETIIPPNGSLHNILSGFDAVVFKRLETNQIVIAYRGTEGSASLDRSIPDYVTDATSIAINGKKLWHGFSLILPYLPGAAAVNARLIHLGESFLNKNSQFTKADQLFKAVKIDYPSADISLTGHSLGGALAQYVAGKNNIYAVTYSAPSVVDLLPKELSKKAYAGVFDDKIINYVNPKDPIAAGAFSEYTRHVGSTYYIDSNYKDANEIYTGPDGTIKRFWNSIFGDTPNHSLDRYSFDKDGNLDNEIFDVATNNRLSCSPRSRKGN